MLSVFLLLTGQTQFKVMVKSLSPKELVRIYVPKPLDRNDGTFLVRYRMHETVHEGLKIEILYGGEHVAQSPYVLKGACHWSPDPRPLGCMHFRRAGMACSQI